MTASTSADRLSEADIRQYCEQGYVVVERMFGPDELSLVERTIDELSQQALQLEDASKLLEWEPGEVDGKKMPRRIYHPFHAHENFAKLATADVMLDRVEQLVGSDIQIQHSKLNMKPAKVGSVVEWHQDLTYFPHTNDDVVTVLVYLDDATIDNGCLRVIPGQHHGYLDHALPDGTFAGMVTEPLDNGEKGKPVALAAPAGSVIFMHCLTPHGSLANTSDRPRRTLIFEYRAADSFPIYYGELTANAEKLARQVRGESKLFARYGKIPALVPRRMEGNVTSLYDLQQRSKSRTKQ